MLSAHPPASVVTVPTSGRFSPSVSIPPTHQQHLPGRGERRATPMLALLGQAIAAWGDPEKVMEVAAQAREAAVTVPSSED